METPLVKQLRDIAAYRTLSATNPFIDRLQTVEWQAAAEIERLEGDLRRLWHFAGCPFDHCEQCIADADFIRGLEKRLGPPTADSVMAQREDR